MNTYRLTNTSHTEVALGLPLLSLPNSFGASRHELFLFDDSEVAARLRDTDDAAVVAHANKIAELLRATDISYLSLREEAKNGVAPMAAEPGSLMAAILQHEQDAFSYTATGHLKRGGWQSSSAEKQSTVAVHQASPGGPSHQVAHQGSWAPSSSPVDSPAAVKVTGIKRKEATGTKVERQHNKKVASVLFSPVKFNQFTDTVVSGLCELLDEFLKGQRLQVDAENFTMVMSALESVQISLMIMTGAGMAKQIYKEELIDHLIDFSRYQIVHTIFLAYDALYRQIHKGAGAGEDEEGDDYMDAPENGVGSAKKSRRKSKVSAKPKKTEANNQLPVTSGNVTETKDVDLMLSSSTILSSSDIDRPTRGFLELESQHPWLLPLLRDCNVPVFDHRFLDCQVAELCSPPEGFSLAQIVVSKFLALQQAGCLSPSELTLQPTNCDALFSFFAASTHHIGISMSSSAALAYNSDELELLRSLPIYKTRRGVYVSVDPQLHCVVFLNVFLQPDDELCLQYQVPEEGGLLCSTLGIPELTDHEVMARFALPGFSAQIEQEQERILVYLHMNWATMRQNEAVVSSMRATKFIRSGDGGVIDDGSTRSLTLFAPPDLLDPQNPLLKRVFSAEVAKFPSGQFATPGWLSILRVAGLWSVMDASLLLDCAVKVEELGQQSSQTSELGNAFDVSEVATDSGSVSTEVWTTAGMLMEALLSNFASVYGTNFCEALGRIAFVPAERGIPNVGGAAGGTRKVLAAYSEAVLLKDWPLAWTSAPILATSSVVPPEFSWGAFRLRSPPAFPTVLAHLEMVGKNRGEDVLACWPNVRGMRSVEDTFGDVLKYLTNAWNGLSSSGV
ncbi:hypothetical protein BDL97_10G095900 [Sphagnum fallax]|nr:hypothetical protein BDL97_10G095900 [Sphagnum fallax]